MVVTVTTTNGVWLIVADSRSRYSRSQPTTG